MNEPVIVRSAALAGAEVSWFAPICDGDDRYLGKRSDQYKSTWAHASQILLRADELGYKNILLPSSYQVGQDTWTFASAVAPHCQQINLLTAIRCGEVHPPMLARAIATLDHILKGRLTINIISSDLPGQRESSETRYARSAEVIDILKQAWTSDHIRIDGTYYTLDLPSAPVKPYQQNGGPLLYFGGYSEAGQDLCARYCDVYLMWPASMPELHGHMQTMSRRAASYGRQIDFGLRVHVIVRETETKAREASRKLMSYLDDQLGENLRERAQDAHSRGVHLQTVLREGADSEGFAEDLLWTGIGRARSGCGAALVGDPDQILAKIRAYMDMGIRAFIFSGYPHLEECESFGKYVLPQLKTFSMPVVQQRIPSGTPDTPLGLGKRF